MNAIPEDPTGTRPLVQHQVSSSSFSNSLIRIFLLLPGPFAPGFVSGLEPVRADSSACFTNVSTSGAFSSIYSLLLPLNLQSLYFIKSTYSETPFLNMKLRQQQIARPKTKNPPSAPYKRLSYVTVFSAQYSNSRCPMKNSGSGSSVTVGPLGVSTVRSGIGRLLFVVLSEVVA